MVGERYLMSKDGACEPQYYTYLFLGITFIVFNFW